MMETTAESGGRALVAVPRAVSNYAAAYAGQGAEDPPPQPASVFGGARISRSVIRSGIGLATRSVIRARVGSGE